MQKAVCILIMLIFKNTIICIPEIHYILIHGTWSAMFSWHTPGGDFYETLASICPKGTVSFFLWSGINSHEARLQAGKELAEYIQQFYSPSTPLAFIGHSHGGNVGIIASHYLQNTPYRIAQFYALATPVDATRYLPNMNIITHFYNFFSFNDLIQPICGFFGREYPSHDRIANIAITINGKEPGHTALHDPIIALWIPSIHKTLSELYYENFEECIFNQPLSIDFTKDCSPKLTVDQNRFFKNVQDLKLIHCLISKKLLKNDMFHL